LELIFRCCLIDDRENTEEDFKNFQNTYVETCGSVDYKSARSCQPFIRSQRNFIILLCCFMIILRLMTLYLLWKYITDEYKNSNDEQITSGSNDDVRTSTATSIA